MPWNHTAVGVCFVASLAGYACAGSESLPTAPSQSQVVLTPELPASQPLPPTQAMLRGRVTEAAPTSILEIHPAVVTIVDGPQAGLSADTNGGGFYAIPGVRPGTFTVAVSAEGFVGMSQVVDFGVQQTVNFQLRPVPETLHYVLTGTMRSTDGTCGASQKPCRTIAFPVHNAGAIHATLEWTSNGPVDLDLVLFQTGVGEPLMRSETRGRQETVSATVTGGVTYELRLTYAAGSSPAEYTVTLTCPN